MMRLSDFFTLLRLHARRSEGQTMAEYAVVLAVITVLTVGVFELLSGGIEGAIGQVIDLLPGAGGDEGGE